MSEWFFGHRKVEYESLYDLGSNQCFQIRRASFLIRHNSYYSFKIFSRF